MSADFNPDHLNADQIDRIVCGDAQPELKQAYDHLQSCDRCKRAIGHARAAMQALLVPAMTECPTESVWERFAAGLEPENSQIPQHAAHCSVCQLRLQTTFASEENSPTPGEEQLLESLRTGRSHWQRSFAKKLANGHTSSPERRLSQAHIWALAFAGGLVAAIALLVIVRLGSQNKIDNLLAQAYSEHRVLEIRFPHAAYSPLAPEQRGADSSRFSRPMLLRAELEISRRSQHPSAQWLQSRARAELLEWKPDIALSDLQRSQASAEKGMDSSLMLDMAAAYYEQAKLYNRPEQYGRAVEALSAVIAKNPSDQIALFNRAINYEALSMYQSAIADWRAYLRIDSKSAWATEAQRRLADLEKFTSPETLRFNNARPSNDIPNPEMHFVEGIRDLAGPACARQNHSFDHQLSAAASVLIKDFQDHWLDDFQRESRSNREAACKLVLAIKANQDGEPEAARANALLALQSFRSLGQSAGVARATLELTFAYQRTPDPGKCVAYAQELARGRNVLRYPWIRIQDLLETATCENMLGELRHGRRELESAYHLSEQYGMKVAQLRAIGLIAEYEAVAGNPTETWEMTIRGLRLFWNGDNPPARAYQLYAGLAYLTEKQHLWSLSSALNREGLHFISMTDNASTTAMAQYRLATDELMAGELEPAWHDFESAEKTFARLPQTASWRTYRSYGQVMRAGLEAHSGDVRAAVERLSKNKETLIGVHDYTIAFLLYRSQAEVALASHNAADARVAIEKMIQVAMRAHDSVARDDERLGWEWQVQDAYRQLCRFYVFDVKDPLRAARVWESYRGLAISSMLSRQIPQAEEMPLPAPDNRSILSYVVLPEIVQIFFFDNRGFWAVSVPVSEHELNRLVVQFRELCSNPESDISALNGNSKTLYGLLIKPIREHLSPTRVLDIEADGPLIRLPFSALLNSQAEPLPSAGLERLLGSADPLRSARIDLATARAVVVAGAPGEPQSELLPSSETELETRSVALRFRDPVILKNPTNSWQRLLDEIKDADVFHFSGHGVIEADSPVLVLGSSGQAPAAGEPVALTQKENLSKCRLVFLAACSVQTRNPASDNDLVSSLLRGGVSFVVASQWDVDSAATRYLTEHFYQNIAAGKSIAIALQEAGQDVSKHPQWTHPYYWAGVELNSRN